MCFIAEKKQGMQGQKLTEKKEKNRK